MKMSILAAPDSPPTLSEDRVDPARRHLAARFSCPPGHRKSGAPGRQAWPGHGTRGRKSPLAAARRGAAVFLGQQPPERRQTAMALEAHGDRPAPPSPTTIIQAQPPRREWPGRQRSAGPRRACTTDRHGVAEARLYADPAPVNPLRKVVIAGSPAYENQPKRHPHGITKP